MDDTVEGADMEDLTRYYEVDESTGCWLWTMAVSSHGYGTYSHPRNVGRPRTQLAHRWMYEQAEGQIPQGYDLDHLCRTERCVNPAHLEPVLPSVNCQRGARAKVTQDDVATIRHIYATSGLSQGAIGERFGIHGSHVSRIVNGVRWPTQPKTRAPK